MPRILPRGEIENLDHTRIPRLRLLGGVGLDTERFVRRAPMPWREGEEPLRLVWCGEFSERKNPAAARAGQRTSMSPPTARVGPTGVSHSASQAAL